MTSLADVANLQKLLQIRIIATQAVVNGFDPARVTTPELELADRELNKQLDKTNELAEITIKLCADDAEWAPHATVFETMHNCIRNSSLQVINHQTQKKLRQPNPMPAFKLEKIKLPQFNGNFADWRSFHDLFEASVDKNPTLSGAEKMIHLKTCLVGEAATIVASFQATAADYLEAWDVVKKRYDNKREIIFSHMKRFDEIKPVLTESAPGLRALADAINECVRSLKILQVPVEHWDLSFIYYSMKKIDPESKKQWSLVRKSTLPTLKEFLEFLESRALALADTSLNSKSTGFNTEKRKSTSHHATRGDQSTSGPPSRCLKCPVDHPLSHCKVFLALPLAERKQFVYQNWFCTKCLRKVHLRGECPDKDEPCSYCNVKHSSLLNPGGAPAQKTAQRTATTPASSSQATPAESTPVVNSSHCIPHQASHHVMLLGTLVATTDDSHGEKQNCRVFVDPGSEPNFISEGCISRLGLKRKPTCVLISGVGEGSVQTAKGVVNLRLHSKVRDFSILIDALVLPKVSNPMPRSTCKSSWPHLKNLDLGDPSYYRTGSIDILLGCAAAARIKLEGLIHGPADGPSAQMTQFRWLLTGEVKPEKNPSVPRKTASYHASSYHAICNEDHECLEDSLEKFWKLEEPDRVEVSLSEEDKRCEEHFLATYGRGEDGRYTVKLPFQNGYPFSSDTPILGHSRSAAIKRFKKVEARLSFTPEVREDYIKGMRSYSELGFMEEIPPEEINCSPESSYYMPHREVIKESSTTTRFRIVFDASAKTSTGHSLNDLLMTGPKLQVDLVPLFIRFRSHPIVLSADITKFYNQVQVDQKDADFQRLVWRESPNQPLQDYRMTRVTFGVTCAPFLAIRCLHQLADDEEKLFPLAASVLKNDFLVDNLLSGAPDVESVLLLQSEVIEVMKRGGLDMRKWSSNVPEVLEAIPIDDRDGQASLRIDDSGVIRTIGLLWRPDLDTFGVSIVTPDLALGSSKRKVLSSIARIFDPLGWLSPVTIRPKILMQELWKAKQDWDSQLPDHLHKMWTTYCRDLEVLKTFSIDRCLVPPYPALPATRLELHGFCDASGSAYSSCVYLRAIGEDGTSRITLIAAKTKVAPVRKESIPRLELCGAVLLAKLMRTIQDALIMDFAVVRCWTDATTVLDWLASTSKQPVFVLNRLRTIEAMYPKERWNYVKTSENPADCASRGISSSSFLAHPLWLHGPPWLSTTDFQSDNLAMAVQKLEVSTVSQFISRCSSFPKMKRVIGYCLRFIQNTRAKRMDRETGPLTSEKLTFSLNRILLCVQAESFPEEINRCLKKEPVKSSMKFLAPFLDDHGILRVGGRLDNSSLDYEKKHPILLPRSHNVTEQIVRFLHRAHLHAGPQLLLAIVREQFWIIRGLDVVKKIVRSCVTCHRYSPSTVQQIMGQLPSSRITPARPFSQCGLDYAGPFRLSLRTGRKPTLMKSYVCLFVCMCTRAIHLEWVSDLTTPAFIAALTRFISRRGLPGDVYCDGGLNFQGAKNEMEEFKRLVESQPHNDALSGFLGDKGVCYHFNPPYGPHHGGLWEAGVKSMKHHLKRVIEDRHLSIEEFVTLLAQVEGCLNSRPLTQMSSDPSDFDALTPGHFLVGSSLSALPQSDLTQRKQSSLTRWQVVQQMFQHFWKRWQSEYLGQLQSRPKWLLPQPDLKVGTLVLMREDSVQWGPLKWKLARISSVFPGADGKTRVVGVTTPSGAVYRRPIVKLSPLPIYE